MPNTSFKNYVVNYDLVVNSTAAEGFEQVARMAQRIQKPLKDISNHFKRLQQSANALKKGGAFEIKPTVDLATFDKQAQTLITKAEKVAAQVNAILNGAFTVNPASAKAKGDKGTKGGTTPSKTEKRTLTTAQLQKEADNVKKQLRDLYGPRGVMRESAKGYKSLMESIQKDAAKLANFKSLRTQLSAINKDIKAAGKNGGKITKTITDGVAMGIVQGTKKGGKKLVQQPQVTKAFEGVLQSLTAGKAVEIPVSVVANAKTVESVNAAMAQMRGQIKPLVIPITVATNIDAAKAVRETVSGLQSVITPSSSGKKPVGKGKGGARRGGTGARPTGISIPVTQAIQPLQNLANGRAISLNTRVISNGQAGFDLNQHLVRLQELALSRPIKIDTRVIPTGTAAFDLNMHIQRLQELAMSRPVRLNTILAPNAVGAKGAAGTPLNAVPMEGVVENVVVSKGVKVSGGPVKVEGMMDKVGLAKGAKVNLPDISRQVANLKELSNVWKTLPKTGSRTFTVNLKTPGIENLAKLKELIGIVNSMPQSTRRIFTAGIGGGGGRGNNGTSTTGIYGGGRRADTRFAERPRGTMNTFAYQLMGNTSLGARTPVFLDMMKGMGMMTGVGAAMGTLTTAFSNASEYQNTMVTAKSILEANYQGSDFNKDFGNMERIVRDVAKKTKFTAPQAADASRFMAMAGLNIPMINASIRPIADVAVIGDNDLGEVADKITNIQTAFGIQPNKMRALADALTKTFTSSNTDMMMLAESMEYAAPMAHLAGAQVEDALAMIGIMGNAGIQGSMAGTTLRMMYQNIINPNKKQRDLWKNKYKVNLVDKNGNPRQLIDILGDLRQRVRISKDDKDEEGKFKDKGTPIAKAVAELFRVTASAGAGTLLENLDKVIALAEANRNAGGLSQRISEVKQNDVKGMWAKMTSAFTDAVVTEFESKENPIKGYIENLTKYFNSSDFKDMLHDIFDLVTSMMDMLGRFAKIWKGIYDALGPVIKYTLMTQFILTQIGYLFAPLRSIWLTFSRGAGAVSGLMGIGGALAPANAAGTVAGGVLGGAANAAMIAAPLSTIAVAKGGTSLSNKTITAAMAGTAIPGTRSGVRRVSYAGTMALEAAIARKQMEWYAAGSLRSDLAKKIHLHKTGVAPIQNIGEIEAAYARTVKLRNIKADEVAAMQVALRERQSEISAAAALRESRRAKGGDIYKRAQRIYGYKHTPWRSFTHGFGKAVQWAPAAISGAALLSGFTSVVGLVGKALGALLNPITLAVGAIGFLGYNIYNFYKQNNKWQEQIKKSGELFNQNLQTAWGATTSISDVFNNIHTIHVNTANINVDNELENVKPISETENFSPAYKALSSEIKTWVDGMLGTENTVIKGTSREVFDDLYNQYIKPLQGVTPYLPNKEEYDKYWGGITGNTNEALAGAQIVRAMIGGQATHSDQYNKAVSDLLQLGSEFANKPLEERVRLYPDYIKSLQDVAEQFNPAKKWGLSSITPQTFQRDMQVAPNQYTEYWATAYNSIQRFIEESPALKAIKAIHELNTGVQLKTEQWWNNIMDIAGSIKLTDDSYKDMGAITIPMKNGHVQFDELKKMLQKSGVKLANDVNTYILWLHDIYNQMHNIEGSQSWLGNLTEEEFLKRAMGSYGRAFYSPYEKNIDNFLNSTKPIQPSIFVPFKSSEEPIFKLNQFSLPINQEQYKPQNNGPIAMTTTPTLHISGPLIKIDSIKGGDGVTAEELQEAVEKAVINTMDMIISPVPLRG